MHVTLLTIGSRGDIQPFVALGCALQSAGHSVRLATHAAFAPLASLHGLEVAPVAGDPGAILATPQGMRWIERGANPVAFVTGGVKLMRPLTEDFLEDVRQVVHNTDALVMCHNAIAAYAVARRAGIPSALAIIAPLVPTGTFASCMSPPPPWNVRAYNAASHHVVEQLMWQPFRSVTNRWCDRGGMERFPWSGPMRAFRESGQPILLNYSPMVIPPAADWPSQVKVTGYWFLNSLPDWRPPPELAAFLDAGSPPVAVGFGSMTDRNADGLADLVVAATQQAGVRAVLLAGWAGLRPSSTPSHICVVDSAPHDWLLPRCLAMVTHGGAGTTGACLRAGIPIITVPFFADQTHWGWVCSGLGVGPPPLPRRKLTVAALAAALRKVAEEADLRTRAALLASKLAAENGTAAAVGELERLVAGQPRGISR